MHCGFQLQYEAGASMAMIIAILNDIHDHLAGMKRIWGLHWNMDGGELAVKDAMKLRGDLIAACNSGQVSEEDIQKTIHKPGSEPVDV